MATRRNDEDDGTSRRDDDDKDRQRDESVINDDGDDDDAQVEHDDDVVEESSGGSGGAFWTAAKFAISGCLLWSALFGGGKRNHNVVSVVERDDEAALLGGDSSHRRLQSVDSSSSLPSYMEPVMKDLEERKKLFADTPPEEVKYWFEYTGPLQKYFYRFSKSRGKADYFEGRDDSGVVSARYIPDAGGNEEFRTMFSGKNKDDDAQQQYARLWENCLAMGSPSRPDTSKGTVWNDWFGGGKSGSKGDNLDRCRVLFAINTVGAGRGTTMLWETHPPAVHAEGPRPWMSEQETAAVHLERNLQEINAMCASGLIAARVQILVCEPIPDLWTEWMDSVLVDCGGKPWPLHRKTSDSANIHVEDRPSPVQIVVMASAATADRCHDLKSGFMEQRQQDLLLAPPYLSASTGQASKQQHGKLQQQQQDPTVKLTSRDLISSDHHDVYVAMRWSSLVTIRAVNSFLQASADMAAAASSPVNQQAAPEEDQDDQHEHVPSSPFLIPSFVRVSYVSEENSKVAKWRMHGDFFHPAAWEICKDSFDVTWIPHSLAGPRMRNVCAPSPPKKLAGSSNAPRDCGQWWVFFTELQMPTSPEVYANEITPAVVQGGSSFFWMLTERQRQEIVKSMVCRHDKQQDHCPAQPQAVIPLGDLESFLINYTPNTALGKHHVQGRRPGYSHEEERKRDRERVRERKQLHGQEDIEKALFDYTIYPAALFRKDATIKAARQRDRVLTKKKGNGDAKEIAVGPQTIKSSYYDVTITKPRLPVPGWCQAMARKGLCALYGDYFRLNDQDDRCAEACGLRRDWSPIKY